MTLTINVPEEVAVQFRSAAAAHGQDISAFLAQAVIEVKTNDLYITGKSRQELPAADIVISGSNAILTDFGARPEFSSIPELPRRSLMSFAGIGQGQPGAIIEDAQSYINTIRDEWDDTEDESHSDGKHEAGLTR